MSRNTNNNNKRNSIIGKGKLIETELKFWRGLKNASKKVELTEEPIAPKIHPNSLKKNV